MKQLPRIYCDMDGVLCDFKKHAEKETGVSIAKWYNLSKTDKWGPIKENRYFRSTMPWMAGGKQLWNFISMYKPHILSAYVEESFDPNCIPGKAAWCRKNLGITGGRVNLVRRRDKQNYAMNAGQPTILIDDYDKNTSQFKSKGGIGITFKSASKAISELKKLGF